MSTIILQSEDVLVIERDEPTSFVTTEVETVLVIEDAEQTGIVHVETETVLLVETEVTVLVETEVETVLVVEDTDIIVLEAAEQGPPGIPGPVGGVPVAGVIDFIYTAEQLTRIDLPDGTYKLFTYLSGKITRIDHVKPTQTVRKDYVWVGEVLDVINVSIL